MSSHKRLRWLLVVVVVELVVIIGLAVWAVTRPGTETQTDKTTNNTETVKEGPLATSLVATDLGAVTDIASVPIEGDKRLFAAERAGTIKVIDKSSGEVTPFLDLSAKVKDDDSEMGLLGLVFHPDFPENGYFFVNYVDKNDTTTVARFQVNAGGLADPASEKVILTVKQPYPNHNAGGLAFGPEDNLLYVTMGDGGSGGDPGNRAQNKAELLGKLLRINVDTDEPYTVPESNPFVNEEGTRPEIWALGLRNPWRIAFDNETNNLYIADVGQGEIEEVDLQPASSKGGENYGWRCYEGTRPYNTEGCQPAGHYVKPIFEYTHETGRCSITGGYVYRGGNIGSLYGKYIYGDLCTGEIFAAEQKDGQWKQAPILKTPYTISTFGQDANRELYVADIESGSIYRLQTDQVN